MLRTPLLSLVAAVLLAGTPLFTAHAWAQGCVDADGDGYTTCQGDCNDADPAIHPGAPERCNGIDDNCDWVIPFNERDADGDGVRLCDVPADCNDYNAAMYPGNVEVCGDGLDNNCNGQVDEAGCVCPDADGDGYQDAACGGTDCDDTNPNVHPGATEVCTDGVDNDCNSFTDCADVAACSADAACVACANADQDGDGYSTAGGVCGPVDCDDTDPNVHPGAAEICDGKDSNCDGIQSPTDVDADGDGVPVCAADCDDNDPNRYPGAAELCNGIDDNCDYVLPPNERDADGDGVRICDTPSDCNDYDAEIAPNLSEICADGKDNNCNGQVDEAGCVCPDRDGDGYTDAACGGQDCDDTNAAVHPGAAEVCTDGLDNDCSGQTDCADPACSTNATCQNCIANDKDGDGYSTAGGVCGPVDCDDTDPNVHPGAAEICDGKDSDCDGTKSPTDVDADGDGVPVCAADCDDNDPNRYPGAPELCNGIDDNCDYVVPADESDPDGDGYMTCANDCAPYDPAINPGATEICGNGIDENCDGIDPPCTGPIDYQTQIQPIFDAQCVRCHGTGGTAPDLSAGPSCYNLVGVPASCAGKTLVVAGNSAASYLMEKVDPSIPTPTCGGKMPAGTTGLTQAEANTIAQWIDQGASCGGGTGGVCTDNDGDGYGAPGDPSCPNGPQTDCDDTNPAVNPGATEILGNGIDDDCNPNTLDDGGTIGATPDVPHDQIACNNCHINGAGGTLDYAAKIPDSQCEQCHTPNGALKASYPTAPDVKAHTDANGSGKYAYTNACVDCHNPMASGMPNIKHVRSVLAGSAVANSIVDFTALSGAGSFADGPPHDANVCETCHTMTNHHRHDGTAPGDLDATGAYVGHNDGADCTTCHPHSGAFLPPQVAPPAPHDQQACSTCHVDPNSYVPNAAIPNSACESCHAPGTPGTANGGSDLKVTTHAGSNYTDPATGQTLSLNCVECHNPMATQVNFRNNVNLKFIRATIRGNNVAFEALTGPYSFADDSAMPADMTTANYLCNTCHTQTNHHQNDGTAPGLQSHHDGEDCTTCHAHNQGFTPTLNGPPPPHNNQACTTCHVTPDTYVANAAIPNSACESCHAPGTPGTANGGSDLKVATHAGNTYTDPTTGQLVSLACVECHNPMAIQTNFRGNTNLKFIRSTIRGNNVAFEATTGPYSFADGSNMPADMTYANYLCNTCHTQTQHHRNDGLAPAQSHNDGVDCTGCHTHDGGFQPVAADCLACHNQSPPAGSTDTRRRQIVEGVPGDGMGDFVKVSHHVNDGSGTQIVTQDDCLVCHDQSQHQTFGDGVSVLLNDQNGGASYVYDGTAASVEGFCLSCHDGAHTTPFPSDPNSPPDIATAWAGSGHAASGVSSCLDCHAQGHGSDFAKLLPQANEPGFCYGCHGNVGPGKDVQAEFAKAYGHPVTATASQVQCLDCHNPHAASDTNKIAGVAGADVNGNLVSTNTQVYQLCLRCHTNKQRTFDPNATQTATGLANTAYHPVAASGRNISQALFNQLKAAFNLATMDDLNSLTIQCTDCHNSEATGNVTGPVTTSNLRTTDRPSHYTGTAVTGPHGSNAASVVNQAGEVPVMLRATYNRTLSTNTNYNYNRNDFALCYLCHDETMLLSSNNTESRFTLHGLHLNKAGAKCATCHYNTHSNVDANNTDYVGLSTIGASTSLVNFAPVVSANNYAKPTWGYFQSQGKMGCDLVCHGKSHNPKTYSTHPAGDYVGGPGSTGGGGTGGGGTGGGGTGGGGTGGGGTGPGTLQVTKAQWDSAKTQLDVRATDGTNGANTLTVDYGGTQYTMTWNGSKGRYELKTTNKNYYQTLTVSSTSGDVVTAQVTYK